MADKKKEVLRKEQKDMILMEAIKYQLADRFHKLHDNLIFQCEGEVQEAPDYLEIKLPMNQSIKVIIKGELDYSFYCNNLQINQEDKMVGHWKETTDRENVIGRPLSEVTIHNFDYVRVYSGGMVIFIYL
ncbi:MAG: hypothetical protein Q8N08_05705 [Methanobacteriaceae archaeon]|nr:hypothetical protein [Methanobacteriaceae archaeon]